MKQNAEILHGIWNKSKDIITSRNIDLDVSPDQIMSSFFCAGPYYYYVVDFYDRQIKYMSPYIEDVLGLDPKTVTFDDIIGQIHPDDIYYVAQAEEKILNYLYKHMGRNKVTEYKMSYCFRFKIADGSYQLFQHQAILLTTDEEGGFAKSLNIHTNINHLTTVNSHKATLTHIIGKYDFFQVDVLNEPALKSMERPFSKREMEVIRLIAEGRRNKEIAKLLFISLQTVNTHRKNIMRKSGTKTGLELIAMCIKEGFI
ncbi:LuxR C-terminal-related transcriptional regulator [Pedobacter hiemivivus]|uniref:LuxR family transcriptional regulator n=1 Tax=Pedobacter hiemivivus TaxID=2530454 RepID=A0A4V2MKD5_9SPHI|nr:LuxR C-terminal-related transcriptional regulator [Pedobacter hiemivivus]TCC97826.1 LuxR family transcriptional regulator [Pedobacter hiemivivus]